MRKSKLIMSGLLFSIFGFPALTLDTWACEKLNPQNCTTQSYVDEVHGACEGAEGESYKIRLQCDAVFKRTQAASTATAHIARLKEENNEMTQGVRKYLDAKKADRLVRRDVRQERREELTNMREDRQDKDPTLTREDRRLLEEKARQEREQARQEYIAKERADALERTRVQGERRQELDAVIVAGQERHSARLAEAQKRREEALAMAEKMKQERLQKLEASKAAQ